MRDENIEMLINTWWDDKATPHQRFYVSSVATGVPEPTLMGSMHIGEEGVVITPVSMPVENLKRYYVQEACKYVQ